MKISKKLENLQSNFEYYATQTAICLTIDDNLNKELEVLLNKIEENYAIGAFYFTIGKVCEDEIKTLNISDHIFEN